MTEIKGIRICFAAVLFGQLVIGGGISLVAYEYSGQSMILMAGAVTTGFVVLLTGLLVVILQKRLTKLTQNLCDTLDRMMSGDVLLSQIAEEETVDSRIDHRLRRLYEAMQQGKCQAEKDRAELQSLLSDISHQVKTPIANLKMLNDTMQNRLMEDEKRQEFLKVSGQQLEKLDFLIEAMVKSSRLETGVIMLEKREASIKETLAVALGGHLETMERKRIRLYVNCPEKLLVCHDVKWTAEAVSNLLDNAVKYTPEGGEIQVQVIPWEMYVRIDVCDTGRGIPESHQAAIFQRFYREPEVHDVEGIGVGLYLTREIVMRQGGYVTVSSEPGCGAVFSVFLPRR